MMEVLIGSFINISKRNNNEWNQGQCSIIIIFFVVSFSLLSQEFSDLVFAEQSASLKICGDKWVPFINPDDDRMGICFALTESIFLSQGYKISKKFYLLLALKNMYWNLNKMLHANFGILKREPKYYSIQNLICLTQFIFLSDMTAKLK
jgi:hypothetical protein